MRLWKKKRKSTGFKPADSILNRIVDYDDLEPTLFEILRDVFSDGWLLSRKESTARDHAMGMSFFSMFFIMLSLLMLTGLIEDSGLYGIFPDLQYFCMIDEQRCELVFVWLPLAPYMLCIMFLHELLLSRAGLRDYDNNITLKKFFRHNRGITITFFSSIGIFVILLCSIIVIPKVQVSLFILFFVWLIWTINKIVKTEPVDK